MMNRALVLVCLCVAALSNATAQSTSSPKPANAPTPVAQSPAKPAARPAAQPAANPVAKPAAPPQAKPENLEPPMAPFSQLAVEGGFGINGVNLQVDTNLNRYINLRGIGNVVKVSVNNITTNGFTVDANVNLATAGASVDFYPFPRHGGRISAGLLFYNGNEASATYTVAGGTSFSLDNYTYYASTTNPVGGTGTINLHPNSTAFTLTGGWGNMIPRKGGHFSFPVELGVAFIGSPDLNITLDKGQVCDATGLHCVDIATDQDVQTHLQAQVAKYKNNLDPLKTFPILTFGVAYNFHLR